VTQWPSAKYTAILTTAWAAHGADVAQVENSSIPTKKATNKKQSKRYLKNFKENRTTNLHTKTCGTRMLMGVFKQPCDIAHAFQFRHELQHEMKK